MRKLIWCCVAGVVVMAACMGMTAQYACQHPDSWASRCVYAAWHVAIDWNPVVQVGRMIGQKSADMMQPAKPACCAKTAMPCTPADPGPEQISPPVIDVIDLGTLQGLNVPAEQEAMADPTPVVVPAGDIEETEPQQEMPPADEEAQQTPAAESGVEYWLGLFRDGGEEASDVEQLPMPKEEAVATSVDDPVTAQEDGQEAEVLPMPHEEEAGETGLKQTGATEESDKAPESVPDCKQSCPYNGAMPHCPASQTAPEEKPMSTADVDTMEYRSTDSKPGEFEPKPMG